MGHELDDPLIAGKPYSYWRSLLAAWLQRRDPACDADALAQDAILRCLRAQASGKTLTSEYLFSAAKHALSDTYRRPLRMLSLEQWSELGWEPPWHDDPEVDSLLDILAAIQYLPERERSVIGLLFVGYRQIQVATMLGIHRRTVFKTTRRAWKRLRASLDLADRKGGRRGRR